MIPIRDDQPRHSTPYINSFLIALNLLIFLLESSLDPDSLRALVYQLGIVPAHLTAFVSVSYTHLTLPTICSV